MDESNDMQFNQNNSNKSEDNESDITNRNAYQVNITESNPITVINFYPED